MAGELGHMTVVPNGNPCGCGNHGCLEKHASATAIVAMARLLSLGENLTSEDVYDLAVAGDEKAKMIFDTWARRWASRSRPWSTFSTFRSSC